MAFWYLNEEAVSLRSTIYSVIRLNEQHVEQLASLVNKVVVI